jgi:hypothetical protein
VEEFASPVPEPSITDYPNRQESDLATASAVSILLAKLRANPAVGATLLPGYSITPNPMTPTERASRYLPRANEKRASDNEDRLARLKAEIERQRAMKPRISDFDLAIALNEAGLTTYTGLAFTATRVHELLKRLKRPS